MSWDLETARLRIGLEADDTAQDAALQSAMDVSLSIVQSYCDRQFMQAREEVRFIEPPANKVFVSRYPIIDVHGVAINENTAAPPDPHRVRVHHKMGYIHLLDAGEGAYEIVVDYTGGYETLPPDLEWALWALFDTFWSESGGASSGEGGTIITGGEVKTVTIFDVGTIAYSTTSASSGSSNGGSTGGGNIGPVLLEPSLRMGTILDLYRRFTI